MSICIWEVPYTYGPIYTYGEEQEQTQVPSAQFAPSMGAIVLSVTLEGWQMSFRKVDQLIFNT